MKIFSIQHRMPGTDDLAIISTAAAKGGYILTKERFC